MTHSLEFLETNSPSLPVSPRKLPVWLCVLAGICLSLIALVALLIGGYYFYVEVPQQSFARIYAEPWSQSNVSAYRLKSRQDFTIAENNLLELTHNPKSQDDPAPFFLLGELYNTIGTSTEAMDAYKQAISIANRSWFNQIRYRDFLDQSQAALAIIYYENNKIPEAQQLLTTMNDMDATDKADLLHAIQDRLENPERADFHLLVGQAFSKALKLKLAANEVLAAGRLTHNPQLKLEAANFLKTEIPKGVRDLSPMARYYSLAGESYQHNEDNFQQAAVLYEKVVHESPSYEWAYNDLATIYRELKDFAKADSNARKAIALNPDFYNPYLTLGDLATDQADYNKAIQHFQTAKSLIQRLGVSDSDSLLANIENQIAYAYEAQGQLSLAGRHYEEAIARAGETDGQNSQDYDYALAGLSRVKASAIKQAKP